MSALDEIKKQYGIGQPIFEQLFTLSDNELKNKVKTVCMNGKGVVDIIDNNCDIKRTIINETPNEILISYYDSIKINYNGIHYIPENGIDSIIIHFNEFFNLNLDGKETKTINIGGYDYDIKKAKFNLSSFDDDGICNQLINKSFVVIEDDEEPRVRLFSKIYDDNNHQSAFNPLNFSKYIYAILKHGDECHIDDLYEILYTNNKNGEIDYDYLDKYMIHDDLKQL